VTSALIFIDLAHSVCYTTDMQDTSPTSNEKMTTDKVLRGVKTYWVWTPPKEMTTHDKEISDAVVKCLRLFARNGRTSQSKQTSPQLRACQITDKPVAL
jgi:hypothetical protein